MDWYEKQLATAPETWAHWTWDAWIPDKTRREIEAFWAGAHRGPRAWLRDAAVCGSPTYGEWYEERAVSGRCIHAWNNIVRLVNDDRVFVGGFDRTYD